MMTKARHRVFAIHDNQAIEIHQDFFYARANDIMIINKRKYIITQKVVNADTLHIYLYIRELPIANMADVLLYGIPFSEN